MKVVNMMLNPALYILMRTDLDSLTPGKAMAQAAHAANQFQTYTNFTVETTEWFRGGFGTTIVLGVTTEREMIEVVQAALEDGFESNIITDSSYPIRDGAVTHHLPLNTCAYAFTSCRHLHPISSLAGLTLYK